MLPRGSIGFIAVVLLLSWSVMILLRPGSSSAASGITMIVPTIVAMIFVLKGGRRGLASMGWRLPRWSYACVSVGLPVLLLGLVLLVDSVGGWISHNPEHLLNRFPTAHVWLNLLLAAPVACRP